MTTTIDHVGRSDTETPARVPDEQGIIERDGVRVHWEAYGAAGPRSCSCPPGRSSTRALEGPDPLPRATLSRRHVRRPRQRALGPTARSRRLTPRREFVEDAVAVLDAAGVESACVAGLSMGGLRALLLAGAHPERVDGVFLIGADDPAAHARPTGARRVRLRRRARPRRGLGEVQPPLLAAGLSRFPRVLLRTDLPRAALDQADRGRRRMGPRHDPRDADR